MNPEEHDSQTPYRLMRVAELVFKVSHAFGPPIDDRLRAEAAVMFERGAGELLYAELGTLGVSDVALDELAAQDRFAETLHTLAPHSMHEIRERVQRIIAVEPCARHALENAVYFTDYRLGRTKND